MTKAQYLSKFPQGPIVIMKNANELANFFETPMGHAVLVYFNRLTVQPNGGTGLNRYNLTDRNFRLWMAIKIIANTDTNLAMRSFAADDDLFNEYIYKRNL